MDDHHPPLILADLLPWVGRSETASDVITPRLEAAFRATLDQAPGKPKEGAPATPGVHWCLAPPVVEMDGLGDDGHPHRGGFLPPVSLPRRMWAGGELTFLDPMRVGDVVTRESQIENVTVKEGRSGELCFVTVLHAWSTVRGIAIRERQDIVYRGMPGQTAAADGEAVAQSDVLCQRSWACGTVLLFRYSALTFNGHRIHYDRRYATEIEGYPDLVVHAPLQATALMMLASEAQGSAPRGFAFRGVYPLFATGQFTVKGNRDGNDMRLWACDRTGRTTMKAEATW